jgi:DNA-binding transcriptional MerR regulator
MKLARAAKALGINPRTLVLWIDRAELTPFFSRPARLPGAQREISDDDLIVANTIRHLRAGVANNAANWPEIAAALAAGERNKQLPAQAITVDSGMSVLEQHIALNTITNERNVALAQAEQYKAEVQQLRAEMAALHQERRGDIERLSQKITDAEARAAAYEAELKLWQAGKLRPE